MAQLLTFVALLVLAVAHTTATTTRMFHQRHMSNCRGNYFSCNHTPPNHCCTYHTHRSNSAAILGIPRGARSELFGHFDARNNVCSHPVKFYKPTNDRNVCLGKAVKPFKGAAYLVDTTGERSDHGQDSDGCVRSVAPDSAFVDAHGGRTYNLTAMARATESEFVDLLHRETALPSEDELARFAAYQIPNEDDGSAEACDASQNLLRCHGDGSQQWGL